MRWSNVVLCVLLGTLFACGGNASTEDAGTDAAVEDAAQDVDAADADASSPCGNGALDPNEACDDDNESSGDGCSATCTVESGFGCAGAPSDCDPICGDGLVVTGEGCDDDELAPGDGCSATCTVELGFTCMGAPSSCGAVCGDGLVLGAEACDDDNEANGDGCSDACALEDGFDCEGAPTVCESVCGDGLIVASEACDDDNEANGDGCTDTCTLEDGFGCDGEPTVCESVCGDGLIVAGEACDDDNEASGDGCSDTCAFEPGFDCEGTPTTCESICGDGLVVGSETCDDDELAPGDGCSPTCTEESGFYCDGAPSTCTTLCNDGIRAGAELCDDGNLITGDGCSPMCLPNSGESCVQPLLPSQATVAGGTHTWVVPAGGVVSTESTFPCDVNTLGPDVVVAYTKTTPTLANGGSLLHVRASQPNTATANYLNLAVRSGDCTDTASAANTCLWYKRDWDSYLDLPAGTYYVWVSKNSPVTMSVPFPETTIVVEEVAPAAAEGEGCYAPYTTESAIYTPPVASGAPHVFNIPATINAFDMGPTWGAPGSISCDNTAPYGDIHGVDAVIAFEKQSPTSVLFVEATNLDPVLTQSALNVEILSVCDPRDPTKVSRNCRANADTHAMTASAPMGTAYIWISAEATGQEMNGATVSIREIFPAMGETAGTATPLLVSGPISPTSTQRYDAPSCFSASAQVHWFKYTNVEDALVITPTTAGGVALFDEGMQPVSCDATGASVARLAAPGAVTYIAVATGAITNLSVLDINYDGVGAEGTDMQVTFPVSPVSDAALAVSAGSLYLALTNSVLTIPKTTGGVGVEHGFAEGITGTHVGSALLFAGGSLFSADTTTSTTGSRIYRLFNGATYGPTAWDLTTNYPVNSPTYALASDDMSMLSATRRTSTSADFYAHTFSTAGIPTWLGTNTSVWYVTALAADSTYFYVASNGTSGEGVYRIARTNIAGPATKIATLDTDTVYGSVQLDSVTNPSVMYVRSAGNVHAILEPDLAATHIGRIITLAGASDHAMVYDRAEGALYVFTTSIDPAGQILRFE